MSQRTNRPRVRLGSSRGFTLLEIMVVIVIIGVMASLAMISIGVLGRDREMQDQAERVWAVVQQAKEECELQGFDVGLRVGANSYDFLRFDARQQLWLPIIDDDLMDARELPAGLRLRLWLEGREVVLLERPDAHAQVDGAAKGEEKDAGQKNPDKKDPDTKDKKKELPPQIMILASGDVNSFDLQFEREGTDSRWHVFSRPDSSVVAEQVLEEI